MFQILNRAIHFEDSAIILRIQANKATLKLFSVSFCIIQHTAVRTRSLRVGSGFSEGNKFLKDKKFSVGGSFQFYGAMEFFLTRLSSPAMTSYEVRTNSEA